MPSCVLDLCASLCMQQEEKREKDQKEKEKKKEEKEGKKVKVKDKEKKKSKHGRMDLKPAPPPTSEHFLPPFFFFFISFSFFSTRPARVGPFWKVWGNRGTFLQAWKGDDDDVDCFYIALFSALRHTHCARM